MAIRPTQNNYQGFTLLEMLITLSIMSILIGLALPSFLTINKPLRIATSQMASQLSLVRSKAISGNRAYRIKPMSTTLADYVGQDNPQGRANKFVVEYAANCAVPPNAINPTPGVPNGQSWARASEFDLTLPKGVGITDVASTTLTIPISGSPSVTVNNNLDWATGPGICFDNRGILQTSPPNTPPRFILKDFNNNNRAKIALFNVTFAGAVELATYDQNNNPVIQGNNAVINNTYLPDY